MMLYFVTSCLCLLLVDFQLVQCFQYKGKEFSIHTETKNSITRSVIYRTNSNPESGWCARSVYTSSYLDIGWDTLDIETNAESEDEEQAYCAGYIEGADTNSAIYDHWYNTVREAYVNDTELWEKIFKHLAVNTVWTDYMVKKHQATDVYWKQVGLFYEQLWGILAGYNSTAPSAKAIPPIDILWMTFKFDIMEIEAALRNESSRSLKDNGHCSALVKVAPNQSDILVAHNSWIGYKEMLRMVKRYTIPLKGLAGSSMSFSSYPGAIISGDDFYIINSGLVAQETTNTNNNKSLYAFINPEGQVLEVVRVTVANRLAQGGKSWAKIFSQYNSGTYNNQWMIVDMKKFSPGSINPNLLWIVEQMPGYIRQEDQTDLLLRQGYWASYNRPFYPDIFNMSGYSELVKNHGDYFSHDKTARALIFQRDHEKVRDVDSMMTLMRSNDFEHDPLSRCECNPPYSANLAIAARYDLNPINGTYPFPALGNGPAGTIDAKVTNYTLSKDLRMLAVNGPTTGTHLPPFQWSRSDYDQLSHRGHPDLFNFQPVYFSWAEEIVRPNQIHSEPSVHMVL